MRKRLLPLITSFVMILSLTACADTTGAKETETSVAAVLSVETSTTVENTPVSVEEPAPEPIVYTLKDGFGGESTIIGSAEDYLAYLDSHAGATIRTTITKMTYADADSAENTDGTVTSTQYVTYIDSSVDLSADGIRSCNRVSTFNDAGQVKPQDAYGISDDEFDAFNNASISEIYKTILKAASLDRHFDSMFVNEDTEITEEEVNAIKESKTYHVVAGTPSDAVFATVLPGEDYKEITLGDMSYDLTEMDGLVLPSYVTANVQYTDKDGVVSTYTVSVVAVPYDDMEGFEEALTCRGDGCTCGYKEPKKEVKAEAPKATNGKPDTTAWGGKIVWEGGMGGCPYSVGDYLIYSVYNDTNGVYFYVAGLSNDGSLMGRTQLQAEEIVKSQTGCDTVDWHTQTLYDGGSKDNYVHCLVRWYTEARWY